MKPSRDLKHAVLRAAAAGTSGMLVDQIAQDGPEVGHSFALTGFTPFDTANRDAFVGHAPCLLHQLRKASAAQARRPPQPLRCPHGRLDVISAKGQRATPHGSFDLCLVARCPFALPPTHLRNDTGGGRTASPLPQTPTQRPTGARLS